MQILKGLCYFSKHVLVNSTSKQHTKNYKLIVMQVLGKPLRQSITRIYKNVVH